MKKITDFNRDRNIPWFEKLLKIMKLFTLLIFISSLSVFANKSYSQTKTLDLQMDKVVLKDALSKIEDQSEFYFMFSSKVIDVNRQVTINVDNEKIEPVLNILFEGTNVNYTIKDRIIVLTTPEIFNANSGSGLQPKSVEGKVFDSKNMPIIGATVIIKGTTKGTITDADGAYSLTNIPDDAILVFSFVGMKTQEVPVGELTTINVILEEETIFLNEVIAIGYGSQRKSDVTAAVSEVDLTSLQDISVPNASRLLQGQAAGVQVNQVSGIPGEDFQIRIRGVSSLGAGSEPLFVIDGFPVGNSLETYVNPNDIESITILKDAASTSIYGARGANGVVLITTKNAKEGEASIRVWSNTGIQNIPDSRKISVLNAQQFAQFQKERIGDNIRRSEGREPDITEIPQAWRYPEQITTSTNWFDEITNQNALTQEYGLLISNGTNKTRSFLSLNYLDQDGSIKKTDYQKFSARINLSNALNKYISVDWNLSAIYSNRNNPGTYDGNFTTSIINSVLVMDPRDPVYNDDGTFNDFIGGRDGVFGYPNPVQRLYEETSLTSRGNVLSNGTIEITPFEGLSIRSSANISLNNTNYRYFKPSTIAGWATPPPSQAYGYESYAKTLNYGIDNIVTYSPSLNNQKLDLMVGNVVQKENYQAISGDGSQYSEDLIPYISAAAQTTADVNYYDWSLAAFFGRVNYSLLDRYLVSATFRKEASSRFGSNNKWGNFPSFSVGWKVSEESFFPVIEAVNQLKLRASWGVTGNNNIGNYSHLARLSTSNYILNDQLVGGKVLSTFGNADLSWETSRQLDVGFDLIMFNGKIVLVAEYYNKITEDMLLPIEIPSISGFTSSLTNIGKVENKGYEFSLIYKNQIGKLGINSNFNIAFNRNKILEINNQSEELFSSNNFYGANSIFRVGQPIGMLYGYVVEGIMETEEDIANYPSHPGSTIGTYRYKDVNGDGEISYDTQDWDIIGNPHPKFTWGWNLNLTYGRFDASVNFVGMHKYDLYRNIEHFTMNVDGVFNTSTVMIDRWRSPEDKGNGWAGTGNFQFTREANSQFVYDASHIWLRNVNVGYNIPKISDLFALHVFLNMDNLALFTQYPGNNPQTNSGDPLNPQIVKIGVDNEVYPVPRILSIGINVNF